MSTTIPPTEENNVRLDITIACVNIMILDTEKTSYQP